MDLSETKIDLDFVSQVGLVSSTKNYTTFKKAFTMVQVNPVTVEFENAPASPFEFIENFNSLLGDFNGDGFIDQAQIETSFSYYYGQPSTTTVSILLGDEDGNFEAVDNSSLSFDGFLNNVEIGEFNGDGNLDIIAEKNSYYGEPKSLILLLGDGSGELTAEEVDLDISTNFINNFNVADVNLDGLDDIQFNYYDFDRQTVILLGDEDGFTPATGSPFVDNDFNQQVLGDFNGDGFIDKAVTETFFSYPSQPATTLSIFLGDENGEFEQNATSTFDFVGSPSLEIGEFDGDGNLDIAIETRIFSNYYYGNSSEFKLTLLLGDGEGDFSLDTEIETEEFPNLNVADVDNDGLEDITSTTFSFVEAVRTFLGDGNNNFEQDQSIRFEDVNVFAAGDVDGDGKPDLAVATDSFNDVTGNSETQVEIFLQDEDGEFEAGEIIDLDDSFDFINELSLVDLNGDGDLDILVKDNFVFDYDTNQSIRQASIILGEGDGEFEDPSPAIETENDFDSPFTVGDFNGDDDFDLAIYTNTYNSYSFDAQLTVLLGDGNEGFTPGGTVEVNNPEDIVPGDFNGDGNLDVLAFTTNTFPFQLELFFGDGDGNLEAQPDLTIESDSFIRDLTTGDFDGDGNVDVSWTSYSYYYYYGSSRDTTVLLGNGDGEFSSPIILTPGGFGDVAIADFDGDGNLDYANSNGYSVQTVSVLLNQTGENPIDTIESDETYTLQPGEENLILIGNSNIDGIGNELDNQITGNRRRNRLEGMSGNDTLDGGDQRDTLIGGEGDDSLVGGDNRDILNGGNGDDNLTGGESRDTFVFATDEPFNGDIGVDTITDFDPDDDSIELSQTTFTSLESEVDDEFSIPAEFAIVADITEVELSEALIVYNQPTGELFYNENSIDPGFGNGGLFATFDDMPILEGDNFTIIA
ncbi:MAG: FG-GAP-like repeat-containing protein [Microcoleaceae cyanobacterium]